MEDAALNGIAMTSGTIASLTATAVLLLAVPILYSVVWKRKNGRNVSWKPLFIGAAGFIVSVRILELGIHLVCIVFDNPISRFITGNTPLFVLYGILMAGIFEECGRYVILKFLMKKNKTPENMVMYGIGHGGMEVWSVTLVTVISYLVIAVTVQTAGMDAALSAMGVTEELISSAASTIRTVAGFGAVTAVWYVAERIFCMFIHIALTLLVAYGIWAKQKKYLLLAIMAHAVLDIVPCLYQRGIGSMWMVEIWLLFSAVVLTVWSKKLYVKMKSEQI
jgi:uncharacterized membrane protein YhfC